MIYQPVFSGARQTRAFISLNRRQMQARCAGETATKVETDKPAEAVAEAAASAEPATPPTPPPPTTTPVAKGERVLALPWVEPPKYLDGTMPCDYGFDPAGLGRGEAWALEWNQEAEVLHCRWAMLGCVGALSVEAVGRGDFWTAPFSASSYALGDEVPESLRANVLFIVMFSVIGFAEAQRRTVEDQNIRLYPGGSSFDPVGLSRDGNAERFLSLKKKEIANGRLAMIAFVGYIVQKWTTGLGPLEALSKTFGTS